MTLSADGGGDIADRLQGRKLSIPSKNDDNRFVRTDEQLSENAPESKELMVYEADANGQNIFDVDNDVDLRERMFGLIQDACGG